MKKLTIIFSAINEGDEPLNTINSIYETVDKKDVDIIVFNDASTEWIDLPEDVKIIHNKQRKGIFANLDKGVKLAKTENIFICNARMRFTPGWAEAGNEALKQEPETLFSTTSVVLTYDQTDIKKSTQKRYGADIEFLHEDERFGLQILEPIWRKAEDEDVYEIPCAMGAAYFITKKWYQHIRGFEGLSTWGGLCAYISLKSWLAGGSVKLLKNVEIGNIYREHGHNKYVFVAEDKYYNKLYTAFTLLRWEDANTLLFSLSGKEYYTILVNRLMYNMNNIMKARNYYKSIRKLDVTNIIRRN